MRRVQLLLMKASRGMKSKMQIEKEITEEHYKGMDVSWDLERNRLTLNAELLNRWLYLKIKGKSLGRYLLERNICRVAIYGMAALGMRLYEELTNDGVLVKYGIDRMPDKVDLRNKLLIVDASEEFDPDIDMVIVTPVLYFDEIGKLINSKISCPIMSIKDLIWEV